MAQTVTATQRLPSKRQTLDEAYAPPANFLEIEVCNPITHGVGKNRYTDYEVKMRVKLVKQYSSERHNCCLEIALKFIC